MTEYHEPVESLPEETRDLHRGIKSLMEELEAVDWYMQRVAATKDESLAAILKHHSDEEIEHACMLVEWLRRKVPKWDENLRKYLFTTVPITQVEEKNGKSDADGDLGIRNLRVLKNVQNDLETSSSKGGK